MTLTQLEAFVLVARLGSVKAAAQVLGVSEPAVSGALAALRQHLGDPLVVAHAGGMDLTPGGQRLVPIASQMVNLAVEADAAIRGAQGAPELLRVVATSTVAEYVARPLLTAFTARVGPVEASVGVTTAAEMPALLIRAAGRRRARSPARRPRSEPMLRYRLVVVAGPRHPLARRRAWARRAWPQHDWLVDAGGADPASEVGVLLTRLRVRDDGCGCSPARRPRGRPPPTARAWRRAVAHLVAGDVDRGRLVVLPVDGHARRPAVVRQHPGRPTGARRRPTKLRRFLDTPDAMQVMHRADGSVPVSRFRPPVYVTLWS